MGPHLYSGHRSGDARVHRARNKSARLSDLLPGRHPLLGLHQGLTRRSDMLLKGKDDAFRSVQLSNALPARQVLVIRWMNPSSVSCHCPSPVRSHWDVDIEEFSEDNSLMISACFGKHFFRPAHKNREDVHDRGPVSSLDKGLRPLLHGSPVPHPSTSSSPVFPSPGTADR